MDPESPDERYVHFTSTHFPSTATVHWLCLFFPIKADITIRIPTTRKSPSNRKGTILTTESLIASAPVCHKNPHTIIKNPTMENTKKIGSSASCLICLYTTIIPITKKNCPIQNATHPACPAYPATSAAATMATLRLRSACRSFRRWSTMRSCANACVSL